jgi:hypothetical protein
MKENRSVIRGMPYELIKFDKKRELDLFRYNQFLFGRYSVKERYRKQVDAVLIQEPSFSDSG